MKQVSRFLVGLTMLLLVMVHETSAQEQPLYAGGTAEVIQEAQIFVKVNGELRTAGRLYKGMIFTPRATTTHYATLRDSSGQTYYIDVMHLTSTATNSTLADFKSNQTQIVKSSKDFIFYDVKGNQLGLLSAGKTVKLIRVENGRGVIELFNKEVYVNLGDFQHDNLVDGTKKISYDAMVSQLQLFAALYPEFTSLERYGVSLEGKTLYALRVGNGKKEVLIDGATHAREHMTTTVVMEMIDQYTKSYVNNEKFEGYNVKTLLDQVSIWFVPMLNPDGVMLVQNGPKGMKNEALLRKLNGNASFTRWKANARGVDINRNFDSGWQYATAASKPGYQNYKGTSAFSEPEARSLRDFVAKHQFKTYISYHSSGQVLFWTNRQTGAQRTRDYNLTKQINKVTGYAIIDEDYSTKGTAYAMDWFIKVYKMPSITVEIAPYVGEREVPLSYWPSIWQKNKTVGLLTAAEASNR